MFHLKRECIARAPTNSVVGPTFPTRRGQARDESEGYAVSLERASIQVPFHRICDDGKPSFSGKCHNSGRVR
jgi:hypothetical protein